MMTTIDVEPPTLIVKLWSPSRAIVSSTTILVKSIQATELPAGTVIVVLGLKSASVQVIQRV